MEYSSSPLFKQGPSALARLTLFASLSLALIVSDVRFKTLEIVHGVLGAVLYPLQRTALVPRDLAMGAVDLAVTNATLRAENAQLHARNLRFSQQAHEAATLAAENKHLRALMLLSQRIGAPTTPADLQYETRDPSTQKVVIGGGSQQGIQNGSPVLSEDGVIGQVTRVYPLQSEVTLVTDKGQAVPVEVVRTGQRSVIYGTANGDLLDLRFMPSSADVQVGDELVTSGLDGVYPQGLPVAKVLSVDKQGEKDFARVVCLPLGAVRGAHQVLVLHMVAQVPPNPLPAEEAAAAAEAKDGKKKSSKGANKTVDTKADIGKAKPAAAASGASSVPAAPAANQPQPAHAKPADIKNPGSRPTSLRGAAATAVEHGGH